MVVTFEFYSRPSYSLFAVYKKQWQFQFWTIKRETHRSLETNQNNNPELSNAASLPNACLVISMSMYL